MSHQDECWVSFLSIKVQRLEELAPHKDFTKVLKQILKACREKNWEEARKKFPLLLQNLDCSNHVDEAFNELSDIDEVFSTWTEVIELLSEAFDILSENLTKTKETAEA